MTNNELNCDRNSSEDIVRSPIAFWVGRIVLVAFIMLVVGQFSKARSEPVSLAGHRAVYDIALENATGRAGNLTASGRVVLEFDGDACQGYTQNMRFLTRYVGPNGPATTSDVQSTTWESGDGSVFRFNSRQYQDGDLKLSSRGNAVRANGTDITVDLKEPEEREFNFREGILFPIEHLKLLIAQAEEGARFVQRDVFDGSDTGDKFSATSAVIGQPVRSEITGIPGVEPLNGMIYWPVSLAYFELGADGEPGEEVPSYQLSFDLFRNGVSTDILIDYGEFALRATLSEIRFFDAMGCDAE
jgi:envelope integrity protein B